MILVRPLIVTNADYHADDIPEIQRVQEPTAKVRYLLDDRTTKTTDHADVRNAVNDTLAETISKERW